jgi:predicted DNA-binding transcriptional regulator AlpA
MGVDTFLRLEAVRQATGLGRSSIYMLMGEAKFPRPVKINGAGGKGKGCRMARK